MARNTYLRISVLALAATAAAVVALLMAHAPAKAATDLLPDLRMARLQNLYIQKTTDGRKLLRFDSIVVNVGAGKMEARGRRPDTSASTMAVTQRIFNDAGGYRDRPTSAVMYYAGDGHTHWHLRDLETFKLIRRDNGAKVGTGAKHGFCFFDNYRFGSRQAPYYTGCATNQPSALRVTMGLSKGWGDIYDASLPDQYIDITGLTSGRYRMRATADQQGWFSEGVESNNYTWVDIQLEGNTVKVVRYGPAA